MNFLFEKISRYNRNLKIWRNNYKNRKCWSVRSHAQTRFLWKKCAICREHWYNSLNECKSNGTNVVEWYSQPLEIFLTISCSKANWFTSNNNPWVFLAICKFKICLETKNMIAENTARKYYRIFLVKGKVARIHYVLCVILHLLAERTRLEKCTAFAVASLYYIPLEISPTGHCG